MAIKLDKPPEPEFSPEVMKSTLAGLQTKMTIFINTYKTMKPQERAQSLQAIKSTVDSINRTYDRLKTIPNTNTGVKFSIETTKQSFRVLLERWRKFEAVLNSDTQ